jgi:hypothetical protein
MLMFVTPDDLSPARSPMPRPTPLPLRAVIRRRWQDGQPTPQIAAELDLPERTVRRLIERFQQRGEAGLVPDYAHPPRAPQGAWQVVDQAA